MVFFALEDKTVIEIVESDFRTEGPIPVSYRFSSEIIDISGFDDISTFALLLKDGSCWFRGSIGTEEKGKELLESFEKLEDPQNYTWEGVWYKLDTQGLKFCNVFCSRGFILFLTKERDLYFIGNCGKLKSTGVFTKIYENVVQVICNNDGYCIVRCDDGSLFSISRDKNAGFYGQLGYLPEEFSEQGRIDKLELNIPEDQEISFVRSYISQTWIVCKSGKVFHIGDTKEGRVSKSDKLVEYDFSKTEEILDLVCGRVRILILTKSSKVFHIGRMADKQQELFKERIQIKDIDGIPEKIYAHRDQFFIMTDKKKTYWQGDFGRYRGFCKGPRGNEGFYLLTDECKKEKVGKIKMGPIRRFFGMDLIVFDEKIRLLLIAKFKETQNIFKMVPIEILNLIVKAYYKIRYLKDPLSDEQVVNKKRKIETS